MRDRFKKVKENWSALRLMRIERLSRRKAVLKNIDLFLNINRLFRQPLGFRRAGGNTERSKYLFYLDATLL